VYAAVFKLSPKPPKLLLSITVVQILPKQSYTSLILLSTLHLTICDGIVRTSDVKLEGARYSVGNSRPHLRT